MLVVFGCVFIREVYIPCASEICIPCVDPKSEDEVFSEVELTLCSRFCSFSVNDLKFVIWNGRPTVWFARSSNVGSSQFLSISMLCLLDTSVSLNTILFGSSFFSVASVFTLYLSTNTNSSSVFTIGFLSRPSFCWEPWNKETKNYEC